MPDPKAFSAPRPRHGQLKVQWGKLYDEDPDLIFAAGDGVPREDRHLMYDALTGHRWMGPLHDKWDFEPSLLEELEARGYDITTLKISIEKKGAPVIAEDTETVQQPARSVPTEGTLHEICGIDPAVSLQLMGQVIEEICTFFDENISDYANAGWPQENSDTDYAIAKQYGFDADAAVILDAEQDNDFATFAREFRYLEELKKHFAELLPGLEAWGTDIQAFSAWYAHCHKDEMDVCTTQVNLILANEAEHRLLSIDKDGNHHICTPQRGELILLDSGCTHAVLPNQSKGLDHMRAYPMRAAFVIVPDVYNR